jgi:hypothetical protein
MAVIDMLHSSTITQAEGGGAHMKKRITSREHVSTQADRDASDSIANVYSKYGRDLSAFFSDVQRLRGTENKNDTGRADSALSPSQIRMKR